MPFLITTGVISLLMLLQPDLGTLSVIILSAVTVYFVAGAKISHLVALAGAGVVGVIGLVAAAPYRLARFTAFLHPERDPQGISYHVWQALIAVGSGGLFGVGLGRSRQKFAYLPEVTGDSIFAVMAEEIGFIFATLFVLLFVYMLYRGLQIAKGSTDRFSRLLVVGIMAWLGFQFFLNVAAMLSLVPITGIPLPFVSAGGSSLLATLAAVGIVTNISRFSKVKA